MEKLKRALELRGVPEAALAALSLAMFLGTWRHWAEYGGDAGTNLYTFWRLSEGDRLYREIDYLHGPLSPLWSAALFRLFGASVMSLAVANLLLTWGIACLLFRAVCARAGGLLAGAMAIFFLAAFAFRNDGLGMNFNYIFPYKPEALHGLLLAFCAFSFFARWLRARALKDLFFASLLAGGTLILSLEHCLALLGSLLPVALWWILREPVRRVRELLALAGGLAAMPFLATLYFLGTQSAGEALAAVFRMEKVAWASRSFASLPFFLQISGWDHPLENSLQLLLASLLAALLLGGLWLAAGWLHARFSSASRLLLPVASAAAAFAAAIFAGGASPWWQLYGRCLPLFLALLLAFVARRLISVRGREPTQLLLFALLLYAALLLSKVALQPYLGGYGAFLGLPAALLFLFFVGEELPSRLAPEKKPPFQAALAGLLLGLSLAHWQLTARNLDNASSTVGRGGDLAYTYGNPALRDEEQLLPRAVAWVEQNVKPDETFQAFPAGDILNYLARRRRSLPYNLDGLFYRLHGEMKILGDLRASPPDFMTIVGDASGLYGFGVFGVDPQYGREIGEWLISHYTPVAEVGSPGLPSTQRFIFYRRK